MTLDRDRVARALPSYEIGEEVGRGAWGVVIRAKHRQLGREVAVKELPQAFAADPAVQRRFVSEARLLATLDHPHIVPIYDYVEGEGLCLLVMELLSGGTVWSRFTSEGVSAEAACSIVIAAASALQHAHGKGILHRDIKPENLLFTGTGTLKVSDFGIAKVVGGAESMATRTGEVLGTPAYMAPEQALGHQLTPATDVYALGTVLYELLSGRLPFVDDGNAIALLYRHVHEEPLALRETAPDLPQVLSATIMRAIATDPAARYTTAEDLGVAVADAASDTLGAGWVRRGGVNVMATGPIGERISNPRPASDPGAPPRATPPAPVTPRITRSVRAPETILEPEVGDASPDELVPVHDVMPDDDAPAAEPAPVEPATPPAPPAPAGAPARTQKPPRTPRPAGKSKRTPLVLGAVVILLIAAVVVVVASSGGGGGSSGGGTTGSTGTPGPPSVTATVNVGPGPDHVAFGNGAPLVTQGSGASGKLLRIDPATNAVSTDAGFTTGLHSLAVDNDVAWITTNNGGPLIRVQLGAQPPQSTVKPLGVGGQIAEVAVGNGSVWLTDFQTGQLLRVDPSSIQVSARIPVGASPDSVVVGEGGVWVANRTAAGTVTRVDPSDGHIVATIPVGVNPDGLAVGAGAIWVANSGNNTVSRIDPGTNKVTATIAAGAGSSFLVVGEGAVWVCNTNANSVSRIDPATNQITDTVPVGGRPNTVTVGAGAVWVVNQADGTVSRIQPGTR